MSTTPITTDFALKAYTVYDSMWKQFSRDWERGRSWAYSNLLKNLTERASELVPYYMTAKEHMAMVNEAAANIKGDGEQTKEDPRELVAGWLRGESELSRIPLEER